MTAPVRADPVIQQFLCSIAPFRHRLDRMILFGSRARGEERPYSDYDILIVVKEVVKEKDRPLIDALYDATMEVLFETQGMISLKIYRTEDFERFASIPTPFMANILRDGVTLG